MRKAKDDTISSFTRDDVQNIIKQTGEYELYILIPRGDGTCIISNGDYTYYFLLSADGKVKQKKRLEISVREKLEALTHFDADAIPQQLDGLFLMLWKNEEDIYDLSLSVVEMKSLMAEALAAIGVETPWIDE
ncbi:MAG: hypothetical protein KDK30_04555 [Leptospiraceae bacterium]|nr:hypothetical protein [Leptospiraceae bacterium]